MSSKIGAAILALTEDDMGKLNNAEWLDNVLEDMRHGFLPQSEAHRAILERFDNGTTDSTGTETENDESRPLEETTGS